MEAMALGKIVEEIMIEGAIITYSNDGSAQSGVGSYVVQSLTIDGVQRALPTYGKVKIHNLMSLYLFLLFDNLISLWYKTCFFMNKTLYL